MSNPQSNSEFFNQLLLDVFCFKQLQANKNKPVPVFCQSSDDFVPTYNCIFNDCPYVGYKTTRNALTYTNTDGEVEKILSLSQERDTDGFVEPEIEEKWKEISLKALQQARDEFADWQKQYDENNKGFGKQENNKD